MSKKPRPDHNVSLVRVVCEACGMEQWNKLNSGCIGCGHPYGRYVRAATEEQTP